MLVLSRKVGQRITIAGGIEIVVAAIEGKRIKLGIEAPKNVPIVRAELPLLPPTGGRPTNCGRELAEA